MTIVLMNYNVYNIYTVAVTSYYPFFDLPVDLQVWAINHWRFRCTGIGLKCGFFLIICRSPSHHITSPSNANQEIIHT